MSYHYDWLMRQIESLITMLRYILTGEKTHMVTIDTRAPATAGENPLYLQLQTLVRQEKICEAENLLYEALEDPGQQVYDAALRFYEDLNRLSDETLTRCNFSRQEILEGLQDICHRLGIPQ